MMSTMNLERWATKISMSLVATSGFTREPGQVFGGLNLVRRRVNDIAE